MVALMKIDNDLINIALSNNEKATILYVSYIDLYSNDWSEKEYEIAKETLGLLTTFCHQLKIFLNSTQTQEDFLRDYVNLSNNTAIHIIKTISRY